MGQIEVAGKNAAAAVDRVICSDASALNIGQAKYSGLLTPDGTFVDDVLVYRMAPSHFMFVANAANVKKDFAWISEQIKAVGDAAAVDSSSRYALLALQGPAAREVLQPLTGVELRDIKPYWFANGEVANARATISRTGYSGEDGFEIFVPPNMIQIRAEIDEVVNGRVDARDNVLKHSPHTATAIAATEWAHPYSREQAAFPLPWVRTRKFWPSVGRIDNPYGDRNLICACPPMEAYEEVLR